MSAKADDDTTPKDAAPVTVDSPPEAPVKTPAKKGKAKTPVGPYITDQPGPSAPSFGGAPTQQVSEK